MLKPGVSLFFEGVQVGGTRLRGMMKSSDVLLVMGTSLDVAPANEIPYLAEVFNKSSYWLNKTPAPEGYLFDKEFVADFGELFVR